MAEEIKIAPLKSGASMNKFLGNEPIVDTEEKSSLKEEENQPEEDVQEEVVAEEESQPTPEKEEEIKEEPKAEEPKEKESEGDETVKTYTQAEFDEKLEDAKFDWEDEYKSSQPKEEYSDFVKSIIEKEKAGYNVDDAKFWAFQNEDLNKTEQKALSDFNTAVDMIADAYQVDNPNVPIEEIKERLSIKYRNLTSGDYESDDPEYKLSELELKGDIRGAKTTLERFQKEISLPKNPEAEAKMEQEEYDKKIEEIRPRAERKFKRRVSKFIENKKSYSFKVGGEDIQYDLSKEDITKVTERLNNLFNTIPNFVTPEGLNEKPIEEGIFNTAFEDEMWRDPQIRDMLFEKGLEHKAAIKQQEVVSDLKNVKAPTDQGTKSNEKVIKSDNEKMRESLRNSRRRF